MKKFIALVLAALMTISMVACGAESNQTQQSIEETNNSDTLTESVEEDEVFTVGDTIQSWDFEVTLTRAEFTNRIQSSTDKDNFMMPLAEDDSTSNFVSTDDENVYLFFSFEYKFNGSSNREYNNHLSPVVEYNGEYLFNEDCVVVTYDDFTEEWCLLGSDGQYPFVNVLGSYYPSVEYKALDSTIYEARGVILLPKEVADNTENPLTLSFTYCSDNEFTIR